MQPNAFVPGAMADSLTSFAGALCQASGQTSLLVFLDAGATGSYGTVVEPCNYLEKFPSPETYFYQSRGFSLAECYYQGITNPYQGLLVGEPLAAPFKHLAGQSMLDVPLGAPLSGITNLWPSSLPTTPPIPFSKSICSSMANGNKPSRTSHRLRATSSKQTSMARLLITQCRPGRPFGP